MWQRMRAVLAAPNTWRYSEFKKAKWTEKAKRIPEQKYSESAEMAESVETIVLELVFIPKDLTLIILSYLAGVTGRFMRTIAGIGSGPPLKTPLACAISGDNFAVVEHYAHRIQVWNPLNWSLKYEWTRNLAVTSTVSTFISYPRDVVIVDDELIFSNTGKRELLVLNVSDGKFIARWGGHSDGDMGLDTRRSLPRGMTVLKDELFIYDGGHCRISVFDIKTREFKRSWGRRGKKDGEFGDGAGHMSICNDELYITTEENNCVQVFNPHDGTFKRKFGKEGDDLGELKKPKGILVLGEEVYVSSDHRITVFCKDGTYLRHWGAKGSGEGQFDSPQGLCYYGDQLFVTEFGNNRIQCFA